MTYYKYDQHIENTRSRFESKYKIQPSGCWEWQPPKDSDGYGQITLNFNGLKFMLRAHRLSWILANKQDWPVNKPIARHLCHYTSCVNPNHIMPGTHWENTLDEIDVGKLGRACKTPYGEFRTVTDAARAEKHVKSTVFRKLNLGKKGYSYV